MGGGVVNHRALKSAGLPALVWIILAVVIGCAGGPAAPEVGPGEPHAGDADLPDDDRAGEDQAPIVASQENPTDTPVATSTDAAQVLGTAEDALRRGRVADAVELFVSVLIDADGTDAGRRARLRLEELAAGLRLEPSARWLDDQGNQVVGDARILGRDGALYPEVILTASLGGGRSVVADMPIRFRFTRGDGLLNRLVTTSDFGQANTAILSVEPGLAEYIVEAMPVVTVEGGEYAFTTVRREFVYRRAEAAVVLVGVHRSPDGVEAGPATADAAYRGIAEAGGAYYALDGSLSPERLEALLSSTQAQIRSVAEEAGAGFLLLLIVDISSIRQVELEGRAFEIFQAFGTGTIRLLRASDGELLYTADTTEIRGQGRNEAVALRDGQQRIREALAERLISDLPWIQGSLGN